MPARQSAISGQPLAQSVLAGFGQHGMVSMSAIMTASPAAISNAAAW